MHNYFIRIASLFVLFNLISSCNLLNQGTDNSNEKKGQSTSQNYKTPEHPYRPSAKKLVDLIHTELKFHLVWEKQELHGTAQLTLKPYFYEIKEMTLDAQGMDIKKVGWVNDKDEFKPLSYDYDSLKLTVQLPKKYTRKDSIDLYIQYVSKPDLLSKKTSKKIREDKGLYFINPLNKIKGKPMQVWTQGEPEANSCWFPTIDAPNEKMTQELYITVDNQFVTLSNGLLKSSVNNEDGTRTDYWKQTLPHAPYLTFFGVGEYAIVKDNWKDLPVHYYVEPKDSADAKGNFGNTPEMIGFFSDILGVEFPWKKYHQIVVRDFVAGAMENTSAVVHADFVFRDENQLLDYDHEDIVAHELMHHWFGDFLTCESWANLTLNEGFATYGEYLWIEYKYGKAKAEKQLYNDLNRYLSDLPRKNLIRFHHDAPRDLFDQHSYAKGALVLHMLRNYLGDDAFFEGIKYYLTQNAFQSVEIHDLRLAMEKVSGEDLNWFFNQWFLSSGHPILEVNYEQKSDSLIVTIEQKQDLNLHPVFQLPIQLNIYQNGKLEEKDIFIDQPKHTFIFETYEKPELITLDPEHKLCIEIIQELTPEQALLKYEKENHYKSKMEALKALKGDTTVYAYDLITKAAKEEEPYFRRVALSYWGGIPDGESDDYKAYLTKVFKTDTVALVRRNALINLKNNFGEDTLLIDLYKTGLIDPSHMVKADALKALIKIKREDAVLRAGTLEDIDDRYLILTLTDLYKGINDESKIKYYQWALENTEGYSKEQVITDFQSYLVKKGAKTIQKGFETLQHHGLYDNSKMIREAAGFAMFELYKVHLKRIEDIEKDITDKEASSKGSDYDLKMLKEKLEELKVIKTDMKILLKELKESEKNKTVLGAWVVGDFVLD